jgi:outer membrane lipopolysaccharide assembly protein LptE/RlpB
MRIHPKTLFDTLVTIAVLTATGCGYHQVGAATHLSSDVRSLAVPIFVTKVQAYHSEVAFTQAIVRELGTRTKYRILQSDTPSADATLHGTILTQAIAPLTYDSASGETSSYLITITAKVILTAHDGRVLYENDNLLYHEQYQSTLDLSGFLQENTPAVSRLSRTFATAVVSDLLESF